MMIGLEIIQMVSLLAMNSVNHIHINFEKNDLHIHCGVELPQQDPPNVTQVESLYIHNCKPGPYWRLISSNTSELPTLKKLDLDDVPEYPPLTEEHFMRLSVEELNITGKQRLEPSPNFLNPLTMMTKMTVSNMVLPPLPEMSQLTTMLLSNGRSSKIGGCSALKLLYLIQWTVEEIPGGWLTSCKKLIAIWIQRMSVDTIHRVVEGARALDLLSIRECNLVTLSANLLAGATRLRSLRIESSGLRLINESAFEHQRSSLYFLDLTNNELRAKTVARAILGLSGLQALYLAKNPLSDFCEYFNKLDGALSPLYLHLEVANIPRLCFASWTSLQVLGLEMNNITEFTLTELPTPNARAMLLTVHLMNNPVRAPPDSFEFFDALYKKFFMLESNYVITIRTSLSLDCDCQYAWFAKALHVLPYIRIIGMVCRNNDSLLVQPRAQLECDKYECEPCTCRTSWKEYETVADCQNRSLSHVPRIPELHSMLASGNLIEAITADDFPTSLQVVDLSNNKLRRVDAATVHALLAEGSERSVRLAGNPLACDCENGPLITALQNYTMRVDDFTQLKCASGETSLAQVSVFELCESGRRVVLLAAVAAGGVLVALVAIATSLYFRYSRVVRVFLHARGLLCCLDDETDAHFHYDAFVSFSHQDMLFVEEELLPRLEDETNGWRICVHYRDWMAGEMIPTQIARSVALSRRTIVVLSRNFLESMWGMLEFRTAYASALHDGRARLVVVAIDDVVDDDRLDGEVRGYVRTNTYVRWGDPWFWDKLLYVMPPRRTSAP